MIEGENYLFIENPKTGTTSIREYLIKHCGGKEVASHQRHAYLTGPHEKFTFVGWRDPMERLYSAYRQQWASYKELAFDEWLEQIENKYGHIIQKTPQLLYASYVDAFIFHEDEGVNHQVRKIMEHLGYDNLKGTKVERRNARERTSCDPHVWERAHEIARKRRLLVDIHRVVR